MTPKQSLLDLADRVEKAEGPDRELDAEIARTLDLLGTYRADFLGWDDVGHAIYRAGPHHYTSSIDAALSLVPANMDYVIRRRFVHVFNMVDERVDYEAYAPTPALALCAASLRALSEGVGG